ncbi:MAG: hypothetical protein AAF916_11725 [Planctomycetota bacterium]
MCVNERLWPAIAEIVSTCKVQLKVHFADGSCSGWSSWLTFPSLSYGEVATFGPFKLDVVHTVELDPIEVVMTGRRLEDQKIDHADQINAALLALAADRLAFKDGRFSVSFASND